MNTPSLDVLTNELHLALGVIGDEKASDQQVAEARNRVEELTTQIVSIAKHSDSPVYLINLTGKQYLLARSYGSFWIPGKRENEPYSVFCVMGRGAKIDTGRGGEATQDRGWRVKLDTVYVTAAAVAKDLAREINGDLPQMQVLRKTAAAPDGRVVKTLGVFISTTRVPTPTLLNEERKKLHAYWAALVTEGNALWAKTKDYKLISDLMREAVDGLGVSTEWHDDYTNRQVCEGCGQSVRNNIAKCPQCGAILDEEKARRLYPQDYAIPPVDDDEEVVAGRGRRKTA